MKIETEQAIEMELAEHYSFFAHNYKFSPLFKNRVWDGKIRLFHRVKKTIYKGLLQSIIDFCNDRNYEVELTFNEEENEISLLDIREYIENNLFVDNFEERDYQTNAIASALRKKRITLLCPTASGKSFIMYVILRYLNKKSLIIVPSTTLVSQLYDDFSDYSSKDDSWNPEEVITKITGGADKTNLKQFTISTWQSIFKLNKKWFIDNGFEAVIVDECLDGSTLINTESGLKRIDQIKTGDVVLTYNENNNIKEYKPVKHVHINNVDKSFEEDMFEIKYEDGSIVKITGNHKVMLGDNTWAETKNLKIGDSIKTIDSKGIDKIFSIKKINKPKKLYNLHIKDNHNYFANGKLVSNCHTASAKSLTGIMEKCEYVPYRIGMTGSINDTQVHELTLTGLFGGIKKVVKTRELIDQNYLSDIKIKMLILKYENFKLASRKYQDEIDFLVENEKRNKFISKLGLSLEGNTLILYNLVEKHGKVLFELIEKLNKTGKKVFFISGKMKGNERNEIRKYVEKEKKDCIIIASYGTFQQGINIVNLHNIIFAHPTKAKIRIIQSIGRGLRKNDEKNQCTLYDISDDLRKGKRLNFSYRHMLERLKLYKLEQFKYKVHKIGM